MSAPDIGEIAESKSVSVPAALAALAPLTGVPKRGKRGPSTSEEGGKARSRGAATSQSLLGNVLPLSSSSSSSFSSSVVSVREQDPASVLAVIPHGVIVASATLTTSEQTGEALERAWQAADRYTIGARLFVETNDGRGHEHCHGLLLFMSDEQAAFFKTTWRSAAGGDERSCILKELGGSAAFLRTGEKTRRDWEDSRGFDEHAAAVLRYASKKRGALLFVASGPFAALPETKREARHCACECGRSLDGSRRDRAAFDGSCRRRLHRRKERAALLSNARPKRGVDCHECFVVPCACDDPDADRSIPEGCHSNGVAWHGDTSALGDSLAGSSTSSVSEPDRVAANEDRE
jgi:hypothetical protein